MNLYEQWLQKADEIGLDVMESVPFESQAKGLICGDCIGLSQNLETTAEKACVLAEEVIHSQINVGDMLDQRVTNNMKQEHKARKILHHNLVDLRTLVSLMKKGYQELSDISEKMGITESLFLEAISDYRERYGICLKVDDEILFLEPTIVLKSQITD